MAESGEISKNALKKAAKAEEAAKKKAEKEAAKQAQKASEPAVASSAKIGGEDDDELDPTKYFENRSRAMKAIEVRITSPVLQLW